MVTHKSYDGKLRRQKLTKRGLTPSQSPFRFPWLGLGIGRLGLGFVRVWDCMMRTEVTVKHGNTLNMLIDMQGIEGRGVAAGVGVDNKSLAALFGTMKLLVMTVKFSFTAIDAVFLHIHLWSICSKYTAWSLRGGCYKQNCVWEGNCTIYCDILICCFCVLHRIGINWIECWANRCNQYLIKLTINC